jgi:hypothetical protein
MVEDGGVGASKLAVGRVRVRVRVRGFVLSRLVFDDL